MSDQYDGPWKEVLEQEFPAALRLFFPSVHAAVDWSQEHVSLDAEFQKLVPGRPAGRGGWTGW